MGLRESFDSVLDQVGQVARTMAVPVMLAVMPGCAGPAPSTLNENSNLGEQELIHENREYLDPAVIPSSSIDSRYLLLIQGDIQTAMKRVLSQECTDHGLECTSFLFFVEGGIFKQKYLPNTSGYTLIPVGMRCEDPESTETVSCTTVCAEYQNGVNFSGFTVTGIGLDSSVGSTVRKSMEGRGMKETLDLTPVFKGPPKKSPKQEDPGSKDRPRYSSSARVPV
ncbi:MAG: hypothetical protein WC882_04850 [Candidatus Gracilibacteria bacterium]